ncbi:UDP-N-acetylmuramoyl-L-alanine--D-glutamate ligase [Lactococcus raffinolactis]|jgi:UDP-N-acetylmuramoylalanine--D-glutamate ligase|uniref:UDP-N-acetylmuramoylalanine--D-glutamate ligase n=1 Tax=Pseudolactococcus raffinolactis TaxID=1366 RepID=A0A2A5SI88_9LACT|nr:UDP-N-acetylmuramoyl-L-alanine--D-glutamate ligase [Lactococcus raffinolactis]MBP6984244.1 UDP-N-acetylmuramoyl-L-alanine--D-glutamate ligase [Lactococcus sp.]ATC61600.1 UDP-N-acetylmuramoyl-L-alanine--D-glutamate ligase [Lactococcus raffinolactis]MDN5414857.1 UDP-N-acetylmuramoyl-L-alanine--D-glutamate ligase [Lactococcus raffinolactis]MDN5467290.1 UDP-N-acetylmuramoyl-L-alanine--D-glutamate ligase [Lactococcus raffinolactis]MDN5493989.1 UDP-N-acetylmuramoyl-L-alanine--D-glutamate ligase [
MKKITNFENKKVLVLGLAKSGESAARVLNQLGAIVTVNDGKPFDENPAAQDLLAEGIKVVTGGHPLDLLEEDFAVMVKNPGIPYNNPMVERAMALKIPIITEVELAYLISESPIVGITGTNGKTTTTTLIADILNADGKVAKLSGNIGFPASDVASKSTADETLIMELSSFQLMGIEAFQPKIAVITNLFSAHLDYHGSQDNYEAAKWRIQENMTADDFLVLNFNQAKLRDKATLTSAQVVPFSTTEIVETGAYVSDGQIYFKGDKIMAVAGLSLPGEHNVENALAAICVAKLSGVSNAAITRVLTTFSGVKHRLQYLGQKAQIKFYNDSKATNILATQKALSGFDNHTLWLLAGGLDRGNGFEELSADVADLKGMIVFGETAPKLRALAESLAIPVYDSKNVATATVLAYSKAEAGDTVLLSPANASWDQYKTFEQRGDLFIDAFTGLEEK